MSVVLFAYIIYLALFGAIFAFSQWAGDRWSKIVLIGAGTGVAFATFAGTPPTSSLLIGQAAALVSVVAFWRWRQARG